MEEECKYTAGMLAQAGLEGRPGFGITVNVPLHVLRRKETVWLQAYLIAQVLHIFSVPDGGGGGGVLTVS